MNRAAVLIAASLLGASGAAAEWAEARTPHFEIYAQAGADRARLLVRRFEQLRTFFAESRILPSGVANQGRLPVRVIEFASAREYAAFQFRRTSDAYFTGNGDRGYIVMSVCDDAAGIAAHEYAHAVQHSGGVKLPRWLAEGFAEVFSTARITGGRAVFGGELPKRAQTLRKREWLSPSLLFAARLEDWSAETRETAAIFYAESWALTAMLMLSPDHRSRFDELLQKFAAGAGSAKALAETYGKSPDELLAEARLWIDRAGRSSQTVMLPTTEALIADRPEMSDLRMRAVLADLLSANGDWIRAEPMYRGIISELPNDAEALASLGMVLLHRGKRQEAAELWHRASVSGSDAQLCMRYAQLADELALPAPAAEHALERALALEPHNDDAHYRLAILKSNRGDYQAAAEQLLQIAAVPAKRKFDYWAALSYAFAELGKRDEAESAARRAQGFAADAEQHARAAQLLHTATTELTVLFGRTPKGELQLMTARVPYGTTGRNPFIQPEDRIRVESATLSEIECTEGQLTAFRFETAAGTLTLSVPDPTRVRIGKGPREFTCGPQNPQSVTVEFAAVDGRTSGVLRGLEFAASFRTSGDFRLPPD